MPSFSDLMGFITHFTSRLIFFFRFLLVHESTLLEKPWPPHIFLCEVSLQEIFYGVELLAPRPTPDQEDQWTKFSLATTLLTVWLG
jgi:hypothetical protein